MRLSKAIFCCALAGLSNAAGARAGEDAPYSSFGLCVRPQTPACIDLAATYRTAGALAACKQELGRYIRAVLDYRSCLDAEMRRANLDANRAIDDFKCATAHQKPCR